MELIDRNELREIWGMADRCENCKQDAGECNYHQYFTRMDFCGWLDDAEVIDAVPVVRCRDCKHHAGGMALDNLWCGKLSMVVAEDFYCKCGERNTDDDHTPAGGAGN